jgi:hypothetical protein
MKVELGIAIDAPIERIWAVLSDFAAYPEWNPYVKAVQGQVAPEARIEMDMLYHTEYNTDKGKRVTEAVEVTAFAPPKYFSWVWKHPRGDWWLSAERIFRLRAREDGKCTFFNEVYFNGMGSVKLFGLLDFQRDALERKVKLAMTKMNDALKERVEGGAES